VIRRALLRPLVGLVAAGWVSVASGWELPEGLPTRGDGLWTIDRTGTLSDGETAFEIQRIWNVCLDAKADRALHELEVREQAASVAPLNETCGEPEFTASGDAVAWTLYCSGPSPAEGEIRKTEIRYTTTWTAPDETRAEIDIVNRDNLIQSRGRFLVRMKRVGACEANRKPGDMMLMHWRVNGEETLKSRQNRNVYDEIANRKALTASRLRR
jgi:hypothetical protein